MSIFEIVTDEGQGIVHAVNYSSAEAQFKWLMSHHTCFCEKHCDEYNKKYSVIMSPLNSTCLNEGFSLLPKGVLVTPLEGGGGLVGTKYIG